MDLCTPVDINSAFIVILGFVFAMNGFPILKLL